MTLNLRNVSRSIFCFSSGLAEQHAVIGFARR